MPRYTIANRPHKSSPKSRITRFGNETAAARKTLSEKIARADERGSHWLAEANAAAERGDHEKAEALYQKGQYWLDLSNKLRGCG